MELLFVKDLKRVPGIISATLPLKEGKQIIFSFSAFLFRIYLKS